jgi:O-antigen/teichoic acid export membrane protein
MSSSRTVNAIRNIFWGYLSRIIGLVIPFILRTVMIYQMGDAYTGINSLFSSILQVLNISELGVGTAIVYSMYQPIVDNDTEKINALLNFYRRVYRIIGCVILGIGLILVPFIPLLIADEYPADINIYIVYIVFLLDTAISYLLFAYRNALFLAFQRSDIDSKVNILFLVVTSIAQVSVIFLFHDYYYYLFVIILFRLAQNMFRYAVSKKVYGMYECKGEISKQEFNKIKDNVKALVCHKIGGTILNSADTIVISAFLGVKLLTKYTNYYYLMTSMEALIMICFASITAGIGNSFLLETREKNTETFKRILFFNGIIVVVTGTVLAISYQTFIRIWLGTAYLFDYKVVVLLINYFFVHTIRRTIITFRDGAGAWRDNQMQPIVSGAMNLVINILLVMKIGIYGIVLSSILCMIVIDIPWETEQFIPKRLNMKSSSYYLSVFGYLISMWVAILSSRYICSKFLFHDLLQLFFDAAVGFAVACIVIVLFYFRTNEFSFFCNLLKGMLGKIRKK